MFHENDSDTELNRTEPYDDSCATGRSISPGGNPLGGVNTQMRVGEGEEVEKQGEGASEESVMCDLCNRGPFKSRRGLGVHKAETKKDLKKRRLVRWTDAELLDLGEKEATLMKEGVKFMNEALLPLCPDRTLEAIKGQRRSKAHKELVQAELERLTAASLRPAGDGDKGALVEGEEGRGEGQGPSRNGPASRTLDRTQGHLNQRIEPERPTEPSSGD